MKILVTGGAGFIGSHVAEYYARQGHPVTVYDNLSRAQLLKKQDTNATFNWDYLARFPNVQRVQADVADFDRVAPYCREADVIFHIAGQTAVTTSVTDPRPDFATNAVGSFNVLEAIRDAATPKTVVYTSTNKVYGDNVNAYDLQAQETRYAFSGAHAHGVAETCPIDHCKHTPYGCSKLAADLYMQDWQRLYGHRVGVFRMSCIYGTRQFGFEDQGWLAWFTIAALTGQPVTIFGDGRQMRDILYVEDLVRLFDAFVQSKSPGGVFNTGGGPRHTLSLLELVKMIEQRVGSRLTIGYDDWRPSDQKAYVSDIRKAQAEFGWQPKIGVAEGVDRLVEWVRANTALWQRPAR